MNKATYQQLRGVVQHWPYSVHCWDARTFYVLLTEFKKQAPADLCEKADAIQDKLIAAI